MSFFGGGLCSRACLLAFIGQDLMGVGGVPPCAISNAYTRYVIEASFISSFLRFAFAMEGRSSSSFLPFLLLFCALLGSNSWLGRLMVVSSSIHRLGFIDSCSIFVTAKRFPICKRLLCCAVLCCAFLFYSLRALFDAHSVFTAEVK